MWPSRGHVTETISRLEGDITTIRAQQRAAEHQLEDAVSTELRGVATVEASRAIQGRSRRLIAEYADAINSLQDELAALGPRQRSGEA